MTVAPAYDARTGDVVRKLELTVLRRVDALLHGDRLGLLPGSGSESGESRVYSPGDDVRRMDWNVTARSLEPHVRDLVADRELETWVLVDLTASMDVGTAKWEKRELAIAATAAVTMLAGRGGGRVGAHVRHGSESPRVIAPARGRRATLGLVSALVATDRLAAGATSVSLEAAIDGLARAHPRRGLRVVVSDFLDAPASWERSLRRLGAHQELLVVEVRDRLEDALPDVGVLLVTDPETGRTREIDTRRVGPAYAARMAEHRESVANAVRAAGAGHLVLDTDRDWVLDLARFVSTRRRMRGRRAAATGRTA